MTVPKSAPDCKRCEALELRVAELEAQLAKLTAKSKTTSRNSSRPPSSDPPWAKPRAGRKDGSKRKRGAQPGRKKTERELLPPDEVDCVKDVRPESCDGCGAALTGDDPAPMRHQVTEIPPVKAHVTEYRQHALECQCCGIRTRASLPEGTPRGSFGPNVWATVGMLTGHYRLSRRSTRDLLANLFGLDISLGAISNIEGRLAEALGPVHAEALEEVQRSAATHIDETGWRENNGRAWLWAAISGTVAAFAIRDSRGGKVAREILGEDPDGVTVSDRYAGYAWLDLDRRQVCWAHLIRDFQKIADSGGETAARIGDELGTLSGGVFQWYYKYRDGDIDRPEWEMRAEDFRRDMVRLLEEGAQSDSWRMPGICRAILKVESAMWTFMYDEEVEPTNNAAERALRRGVLWRKTSLGTQSERGSRYVERMLTCTETLRLRGKGMLGYLLDVCRAWFAGRPVPSLVSY